jgi:Cu2+-containing amine oxidase
LNRGGRGGFVLKRFHPVPRPEDYQVMPTESIGFKISPSGFIANNPALDAPK